MSAATRRPRKRARRDFGSVRQERSGRYSAHYPDPFTGARRPAPRTFETERAADDWLTTVRADVIRGELRPEALGAMPLAEFMASWIERHTGLSQSTRDQYANHLRRWIDRELSVRPNGKGAGRTVHLGRLPLKALSVGVVGEWFAAAVYTQQHEQATRKAVAEFKADRRHPARVWAEASGVPCAATGRLAPTVVKAWKRAGSPTPQPEVPDLDPDARPATIVRQAYRMLRACLNAAVRESLIEANPCQIPGAGTAKAAERQPAGMAEIRALAAAMPERYAAAVIVAAWSGLRAGELFGLARRHVDLVKGTLRVERAMKQPHNGPPVLGRLKTDSSRRTVHLPAFVVEALQAHMKAHTPRGADALVFGREDGSLTPPWLRRAMWHRARSAVGRDDLRWHDLRHTGATLAAQTGASIRDLQHRMGHSTTAAALNYQHASAEQDRTIAERLDQLAMSERTGNVVLLRPAHPAQPAREENRV